MAKSTRRSTAKSVRTGTAKSTKRVGAKANDDPARPTIVYIHGIGEQPPRAECKVSWDIALFGRDMRERTRMAYWCDIRHPDVERPRTRALGRSTDGLGENDAPIEIAALLREAKLSSKNARGAEAYAEALADTLAKNAASSSDVRTRSVHAKFLPIPRSWREALTKSLTKSLIKDTAAYFYDAVQREAMRQRLRDELRAVGGPIVLVSHSQGTIISYDVLTELKGELPIKHWITLGSPLGVQEVQDNLRRLGGLGTPLPAPRGVGAWNNFADLLDPVALDKGLAQDFKGEPAVDDTMVVNADTLSFSNFNPHSSTGYLRTKAVRKCVEHSLGAASDRMATFFIARDVQSVDGDELGRRAVLIEIRDEKAFASAASLQRKEALDKEPLADGIAAARRKPRAALDSLDERREAIVVALKQAAGESSEDELGIERLRRFVAARLTMPELATLALREHELPIYSIWRNSKKRTLLHRSADVVQAPAAQIAYKALGRNINWAVLDTGVQSDHPHFNGRIDKLWDCTVRGALKQPLASMSDPDGHGTHVSGIISGRGQQLGRGDIAGIAPEAKLHVYKVLADNGEGDDAWIIKALDHIATTNERASQLVIHGVNLSLGGPFDPENYGCGHSPICQELRRLWRQGVVVCVACGNEGLVTVKTSDGDFDLTTGHSIGDPANLEECLAVGSINADKPHVYGISYFSSRGPTADGRAKPDLVAPGEHILSCSSRYRVKGREEPYAELSGTSMACPHVSGLVAAFLSVRREFIGRPDELKKIVLDNCTSLGRDRYHQGAGMPNLVKMLSNT